MTIDIPSPPFPPSPISFFLFFFFGFARIYFHSFISTLALAPVFPPPPLFFDLFPFLFPLHLLLFQVICVPTENTLDGAVGGRNYSGSIGGKLFAQK